MDQASAHLRSLLADRSVLIVDDDAWEPEHVRPFLVGGQRGRVLITTRRADVADEVGAKLHELDILNSGYDISGSFYNVHTTGGLLSAGDHAPCPEPSHS